MKVFFQSMATITSEALMIVVTWLPSLRPSSSTASTVIDALSFTETSWNG